MATIGGTNLGTATGKIRIDTADIEKTTVTVKRVSRELKKSFDDAGKSGGTLGTRIGAGLKTAGNQITSISRKIGGLRNEILGISAVGAGITFVGIKAASNIQAAQIQLKGLTGSTEEAAQLMELLREQAAKAGVPFGDILAASKSLLPTLEGNTAELEKFLPLVQRVAVLNQQEGLSGAAFSINEALSSGGTDLVSLSERFNISRTLLREALEQTGGDFAAALDIVLNKMGITAQTADEMGRSFDSSFRVAKDAANQLLAAGFQPILEIMTPILQKSAEWLNQLRQTAPAVATMGASIAGITAVGGPSLIFISSMISAVGNLKSALLALKASGALAALGSAALPLAVGGAALATGAVAGNAIGRGIGKATGNEEIANTTLDKIPKILQMAAVIVADGASKIVTIIINGMSLVVQEFSNGVGTMLTVMGSFVRGVAQLIPGGAGNDVDQVGANLQEFGKALPLATEEIRKATLRGVVSDQEEFVRGVINAVGLGDSIAPQGGSTSTSDAGGQDAAAQTAAFADEQIQAITAYYDQLASIEDSRRSQRLTAEAAYQEQRSSIVSDYNRSTAREDEDFLRSRKRANQQFARDVAAITEERIERETDWLNDLNESITEITTDTTEKIAELREDGNERIAEIEEDYNDQREQAARQHANTLLNAASRLDAGAIAEEKRRYALQASTAETEFTKRVASEKESLNERIQQEQEGAQERIQQEREAHALRIAEARQADEERLADMRESLALQQHQEDEDRAIRLQRTREDHQRQLTEMQEANRERLLEINKQAALEKQQLKENFQEQLADMGIASAAYLNEQEAKQDKSLELFEKYWEDWEKVIDDQDTGDSGKSYASGGTVDYTGNARVHGTRSRPEYMLNQETTSRLQDMMGSFSQQGLVNAVAGGGAGGGVNVGGINMSINANGNQSATDIATAVENRLISLFRSLS